MLKKYFKSTTEMPVLWLFFRNKQIKELVEKFFVFELKDGSKWFKLDVITLLLQNITKIILYKPQLNELKMKHVTQFLNKLPTKSKLTEIIFGVHPNSCWLDSTKMLRFNKILKEKAINWIISNECEILGVNGVWGVTKQ